MVTVEDFSRLVSGIYSAAVAPDRWELALREIQRTLDGNCVVLSVAEPSNRSFLSATLPMEAGKAYAERFHRLDEEVAAAEKGPIGAVRGSAELVGPSRNPEFYADFLRRFEVDAGLFVRLTGGPRSVCLVAASPRPAFDSPERVKLVSGLVVHFQQALCTQSKLAGLAHSNTDLAGALEAVRHGMIVVGRGCWVINLNTAAEAMLRAEDGVHVRFGRIGATYTHTERKLNCALHAALVGDDDHLRSGRSFICERPSGKRSYVIRVLPLRHTAAGMTPTEATALVLIIDPEHEREPSAALLRRIHGLTNAEAKVALGIVRGADIKEIAEELSVSPATIRTHLQHVFDKTDTHRQAELVRQLLTLSA